MFKSTLEIADIFPLGFDIEYITYNKKDSMHPTLANKALECKITYPGGCCLIWDVSLKKILRRAISVMLEKEALLRVDKDSN